MQEKFFFPINKLEDMFQIIEEIGQGTYGKVYKCKDLKNDMIVALKKINILKPNDGFPINTIREINLLQNLHHDNIIGLRSIVTVPQNDNTTVVYLSFDYCEFDLYGLLYCPDPNPLTKFRIISYIKQLLLSLVICETNSIVHRDLKPANLFITRKNILKVGDFGLARKLMEGNPRYTSNVITLYYRAPELLFGIQSYKYEVDIWSVGCIIYEIITKNILFKCTRGTDSDQIKSIFEICGTPNFNEWPTIENNEFEMFFKTILPNKLKNHLENTIPKEFSTSIDLIMKMLELTPSKRIKASDAIKHPFLMEFNNLIEPSKLPPLDLPDLHQMKASELKKKNRIIKDINPIRPNEEK